MATAIVELRKLVRPIPLLMDVEGNWDRDAQRVVIGGSAGPSVEVENAAHEVGHLFVVSDENINKPSWGLKYKKWVSCPFTKFGGWHEVNTCQDVQLEAKVWAAQSVLLSKIGVRFNIGELVKSAKWLGGFCYVPHPLSTGHCADEVRFKVITDWVMAHRDSKAFRAEAIIAEIARKKKLWKK